MLTAYMDESGHDPQSEVCVFAGFLGPQGVWESVEQRWKAVLGLLPNLHTARFLRENDYARDLTWEQKVEKLSELAHVMIESDVAPVVAGVHRADYDVTVKGKLRKRYTSPYMLCVQLAVAFVLDKMPSDERVVFIIEHNQQYRNELCDLQRLFLEWNTDARLFGLMHVRKGATVITEAADYLAYAIRQQVIGKRSREAEATRPILHDGNVLGFVYTRDVLAKIVSQLSETYSEP